MTPTSWYINPNQFRMNKVTVRPMSDDVKRQPAGQAPIPLAPPGRAGHGDPTRGARGRPRVVRRERLLRDHCRRDRGPGAGCPSTPSTRPSDASPRCSASSSRPRSPAPINRARRTARLRHPDAGRRFGPRRRSPSTRRRSPRIHQRMAPVFLALRDAATGDRACADLWTEIAGRRAANMRAWPPTCGAPANSAPTCPTIRSPTSSGA